MKLLDKIQQKPFLFVRKTNVPLPLLKDTLARYPNLELTPVFQRGRVWSLEQQIAFVERFIRCPQSVDCIIAFNDLRLFKKAVPSKQNDMIVDKIVCLDGLQRLTALTDFLDGKFAIFGDIKWKDIEDSEDYNKIVGSLDLEFHFYYFETNKEVIDFYVDLNSKGVPHTAEEIERVKQLLHS